MAATGLTLLIGGARCGKSDLAVRIGERHRGQVTFVATARRVDGDMSERIDRHRRERPPWPTIEEPTDLVGALESVDGDDSTHLVIVDCLTLWVSNVSLAGWPEPTLHEQSRLAASIAANRRAPTVVVTNEVGLGIHPETQLGRQYRDLLGRVNRQWAAASERSLFVVAGQAVLLGDPWAWLS